MMLGYGLDDTNLIRLNQILDSVEALTKKERGQEEYNEYVRRVVCESSDLPTIVKLGDLSHNMSDLDHGSQRDKYSLTKDILLNSLRCSGIITYDMALEIDKTYFPKESQKIIDRASRFCLNASR